MLVLTREEGQSLRIGDIVVSVMAIKGKKVRIGVAAPRDIPVHREEIYQAIKAEKEVKTPSG